MKIPLWLIALLFAGYTVWCANYWHHYCKSRCCDEATTTTAPANTTGVPLFDWNTQRPVQDAKFPEWKKTLLAQGGQGDTLVITAYYRANEPSGEQLAMQRAQALKAMMMPEIPESRIKLLTKQIPDDGLAQGSAPMESAGFSWNKMVLKQDQGAIIESDNAVTFLFPSNSTERDRNQEVEAYLRKLIEKHKNTNSTFSLVGYTDDVGDADKNQQLGLARAKTIGLFLAKNGIDQKRIQITSKGEADPVADNSTDDGRHQNRRVVLTTINH